MQDVLSIIQKVIDFLQNMELAGLDMITWIVIIIVISALGFIIRGNK